MNIVTQSRTLYLLVSLFVAGTAINGMQNPNSKEDNPISSLTPEEERFYASMKPTIYVPREVRELERNKRNLINRALELAIFKGKSQSYCRYSKTNYPKFSRMN